MRKKFVAIFYAFLAAMLVTTSAGAGGSVKLSSATFRLGSLIADGTLIGLGKTTTTIVVLDASGPADITCTNPGRNPVPGRSSPRVFASGQQQVGNNGLQKNGKSPFEVETDDPTIVPWNEAGCPNSSWTGHVDFIYWTEATIRVLDTATNAVLLEQQYTCTTTRFPPTVSCTPIP